MALSENTWGVLLTALMVKLNLTELPLTAADMIAGRAWDLDVNDIAGTHDGVLVRVPVAIDEDED